MKLLSALHKLFSDLCGKNKFGNKHTILYIVDMYDMCTNTCININIQYTYTSIVCTYGVCNILIIK